MEHLRLHFRPHLLAGVFALSWGLLCAPARAQSKLSFQDGVAPEWGIVGSRDTTLRRRDPERGHPHEQTLSCAGSSEVALVRWDLSRHLPRGLVAREVAVQLNVTSAQPGSLLQIHALNRAWTEQATWLRPDKTTAWQIPAAGGEQDTDPLPWGEASAPAPLPGQVRLILGPAGLARVQGWIDDPGSNHGILLRSGGRWELISRDSHEVGFRPRLEIWWQLPPPPTPLTLKTIKGGRRWGDPSAWSPPGLPGAGDMARVVGRGEVRKEEATTQTVARLDIGRSARLSVAAGTINVSGLTAVRDDGSSLVVGTEGTLRGGGPVWVFPGSRMELSGGTLRLGPEPLWIGGLLRAEGGQLIADDPARPMDVRIRGRLYLDGLLFRGGDLEGLHVWPGASLDRLKGCRFEGLPPQARARYLTIEAPQLNLNAPGCYFGPVAEGQHNVLLRDTAPEIQGDVVLNLERRSREEIHGPGAGEEWEEELDGAALNWVHAAPDTTRGVALGVPQVAWDARSLTAHATYVAFRDVDGLGSSDRIHVFDGQGEGRDAGYWFEVPQSQGDLTSPPLWDELEEGQRVVYGVTTSGLLLRFTDPGSPPPEPAVAPDFVRTILDDGQPVEFTSELSSDSHSLLFVGGLSAGSPRLFALRREDGALSWSLPLNISQPLRGPLPTTLIRGATKILVSGNRLKTDPEGVLLREAFDVSPGRFAFQADAFRDTSSGDLVRGEYLPSGGQSGGGLELVLGPRGRNLSAGWSAEFDSSGRETLVQIAFSYRLVSSSRFEANEFCEALLALDGELQGLSSEFLLRQVGDGNEGLDQDSGWRRVVLYRLLSPGAHSLQLGCFLNKSTEPEETVRFLLDDVRVTKASGRGVVYRVDTQARLIDLQNDGILGPLLESPALLLDGSAWLADREGRLYTLDTDDLSLVERGSPGPTGRGRLWVDSFAGQVFRGDPGGRVWGYDLEGAQLPSFPLDNPLGNRAPLGPGLWSGGGVLWVVGEEGRLRAVDVSSGTPCSPTYRLGRGASTEGLGGDFEGRLLVSHALGRFLVVAAAEDPTPR